MTSKTAFSDADRAAMLRTADRLAETARRRKAGTASARRARLALPLTARDREIEPVEAWVDDPYEPGSKTRTQVNRRVDLLEAEVSHRRIGPVQYSTGRIVEAVLERAGGRSGGWGEGTRADPVTARELRMIYAITDARTIAAYLDRITRAIGPYDARLLRRLLGERMSFAETAALLGKGSGDKGVRYVAERFRDALAELAERWAAKGVAKLDEEGRPIVYGEMAPESGPEDTDVNGVQVPEGQGYTLASDPAARWQPNWAKRRRVEVGERVRRGIHEPA